MRKRLLEESNEHRHESCAVLQSSKSLSDWVDDPTTWRKERNDDLELVRQEVGSWVHWRMKNVECLEDDGVERDGGDKFGESEITLRELAASHLLDEDMQHLARSWFRGMEPAKRDDLDGASRVQERAAAKRSVYIRASTWVDPTHAVRGASPASGCSIKWSRWLTKPSEIMCSGATPFERKLVSKRSSKL